MSYAEQLKDPRWQKKRLEVMERDDWTCQMCSSTEATLTVHHKSYKHSDEKFADIWDYDGDDLITLCEKCHSTEEVMLKELQKKLFFTVRGFSDNAKAIVAVTSVLNTMNIQQGRRVKEEDLIELFSVYDVYMSTTEKQKKQAWFKKLKAKVEDRIKLAIHNKSRG